MPIDKLGITVEWRLAVLNSGVDIMDTETKEVLRKYESMADVECPAFVRKSLFFKYPLENLLL